jgi:DNA-directed RNA polymerase subunit RPC12/RpoP
MGIRFYCPNGHKLNVKAFQAGRKGICPYCGSKIQIPEQSTRKSGKESQRAGRRRGAGVRAGTPATGFSPGPQGGYPVASPQPNGVAAMESPASPGSAEAFPAEPLAGYCSPSRSDVPEPGGPAAAEPIEAARPSPTVVAAPSASPGPVPQDPAGLSGGHPSSNGGTPAGEAPGPPASPAGPTGTSPSASVPRDPLSEGGNVVWYVRPPSGGQFGPATPDIMRSWIEQGRVSPESLVWREGWQDWQDAGEVFPQLGAGQQASPFRQFDQAGTTVAQPASPTMHRRRSRRQSQAVQVAVVITLVLAVLLLFGVFLWVLTHDDESSPVNTRPGDPATGLALEAKASLAALVS